MDLEHIENEFLRGPNTSAPSIGSLFQPDALVSDQYLDNYRHTTLDPERELMLAILRDGIDTYQDNRTAEGGRRKRLYDEARDWIFSDSTDWVFSFVSVCSALGLDPDYVRKGLGRKEQLRRNAANN
jgi:hypothetical protein